MPTIHTINSIKIDLYSREHLPPHFHALYAEYEILIVIKTLKTYAGEIPKKQYNQLIKWASDKKVQENLLENFYRLNPKLRK
jgi:hypothetical protein